MGDATQASRNTPQRPCRVANCSGSRTDPGYQMHRQATLGHVDFITGDYIAELTLADLAEEVKAGRSQGWEASAWNGLEQTLGIIKAKGTKIIINGGALNPRGLAQKTQAFVDQNNLGLKVAYVYGDDLKETVTKDLETTRQLPRHLDGENEGITVADHELLDTKSNPIVTANAYLGARAIVKGLEAGADVILCGRVADASPVIGAAWYWHKWAETDYDRLAGCLAAGHLIECGPYATGANYPGWDDYPLEQFLDLSFGIAEVAADGTAIITKHDGTNGVVNRDTLRSQFLYELQGAIYLNPDVSADVSQAKIEDVGPNRVRVSNVKGYPPPPTTKLAISYHGGYMAQLLTNAAGYGTARKWQFFEKQVRFFLEKNGLINKFKELDFQVIGSPAPNPRTQMSATTYGRIFAQAAEEATVAGLLTTWVECALQHFPGQHLSLDVRTALPRPFHAYYPGLFSQDRLKEGVAILGPGGVIDTDIDATHPPEYKSLSLRESYETAQPVDIGSYGPTRKVALGDCFLARSGDKGANVNIGIFVRIPEHYPWLQAFMTRARLQELIGDDWRKEFFIERVEFPNLEAVHFVVYGILGRGASSCNLLDSLGKGFADYIRAKEIDIPVKFLDEVDDLRRSIQAT